MTAASGQAAMHKPYVPLPVGFINVENNSIEAIEAAATEKTCAIMLEPVQAEGGVNIADDDFLRKVREWCDGKGILLILDEVQTGIGRLGTLFGYQLYDVEPDIITLAKGLGAGVPIGAVLAKEHASVFVPGDHNATFGGNPLTNAAACAALKYVIDNDVAGNAAKMGRYLMQKFMELRDKYPFITDIRGRGLLVAMEFNSDIAQSVLMTCLEKGLLINKLKPDTIRMIPPLIIDEEDVNLAIDILDEVLAGIDA
jgi:acetylornithine/succinyldiaminopimelate/putrescine aminotransferase